MRVGPPCWGQCPGKTRKGHPSSLPPRRTPTRTESAGFPSPEQWETNVCCLSPQPAVGSPSARPPARSAGHWGQGGRGAQSGCSRWPGGPRPPGHRAGKRSPTALAGSIRRRAAKPTRTMSLWGPNMGRAWDKKKKRCSPATYLAMLGLPVSAIGVGQVAVLVPPATVMRQGTVAEGDIVVSVESRKLPPVVVSQSVPCRREDNRGEDKSHPGVGLVPWPERGLSRTVPRLENAKDPAGDVTGSQPLLSTNG